jgi:cell division septum initiation protein DivIVA
MGEDPEQLERDIEATRARLGADIDALEEKINPKKVAHRSVDSAKEKAVEAKNKLVGAAGTAKDKVSDTLSPDHADGESGPGLGEKVAGLAGTVKEKAAPLVETAREKAAPLVETAREKAAPLVEKATPMAESVKERAAVRAGLDPRTADSKQVATALAGGAWATVQDRTRRDPLLVGAVAFVLGVLLGR